MCDRNRAVSGLFPTPMRISKTVLFACLVFSAPSLLAAAGWHTLGNVSNVQVLPNGVEVTAGSAKVRVVALSPNVVRFHCAPDGKFPPEQSFAVLPGAFPNAPAVKVEQSRDALTLSTDALRVKILRAPFSIAFLAADGSVISQDDPHAPVSFNGSEFRVWKSMPEDEHYFALGDKAGPLDHRNIAFTMWNTDAFGWQETTDPLYKDIPFFLATRKGAAYGVFLDNTYRSIFDFG